MHTIKLAPAAAAAAALLVAAPGSAAAVGRHAGRGLHHPAAHDCRVSIDVTPRHSPSLSNVLEYEIARPPKR